MGLGKGQTPIFVAALRSNVGIVRELLKQNANANFASPSHAAPLWAAAHKGHTDVVKMLLRSRPGKPKTNIDFVPATMAETALGAALRCGHSGVAQVLRMYGAEKKVGLDLTQILDFG